MSAALIDEAHRAACAHATFDDALRAGAEVVQTALRVEGRGLAASGFFDDVTLGALHARETWARYLHAEQRAAIGEAAAISARQDALRALEDFAPYEMLAALEPFKKVLDAVMLAARLPREQRALAEQAFHALEAEAAAREMAATGRG